MESGSDHFSTASEGEAGKIGMTHDRRLTRFESLSAIACDNTAHISSSKIILSNSKMNAVFLNQENKLHVWATLGKNTFLTDEKGIIVSINKEGITDDGALVPDRTYTIVNVKAPLVSAYFAAFEKDKRDGKNEHSYIFDYDSVRRLPPLSRPVGV